jgi:hypothetical protein
MLGRKQGTGGPDIVPIDVNLFGTNVTGIAIGAQFEAVAQSYLGQIQRYETTESILKLLQEQVPNNWNGTPQ